MRRREVGVATAWVRAAMAMRTTQTAGWWRAACRSLQLMMQVSAAAGIGAWAEAAGVWA